MKFIYLNRPFRVTFGTSKPSKMGILEGTKNSASSCHGTEKKIQRKEPNLSKLFENDA